MDGLLFKRAIDLQLTKNDKKTSFYYKCDRTQHICNQYVNFS